MKDYKPFQFKQFLIHQKYAAMKVGTDSVLLGAWTSIYENEHILDVGTGTALLSIMLAQKARGKCKIDAIEIDTEALRDAQQNIDTSPWPGSINLIEGDFSTFESNRLYDVVISNPPFYTGDISPNPSRATARSTQQRLSFEILLRQTTRILKQGGRLYLIVPFDQTNKLIRLAHKLNLYVHSVLNVFPNENKPANRALIEFFKEVKTDEIQIGRLVIYEKPNQYTKLFKDLTKDFYLSI